MEQPKKHVDWNHGEEIDMLPESWHVGWQLFFMDYGPLWSSVAML